VNRARWQPLLPTFPGRRVLLIDTAVGLGLAALSGFVTGHWTNHFGPAAARRDLDGLGLVLLLIGPLSISARRAWPAGVLAVVVATTAAYIALGYPYGPALLSPALAAYAVGSRLPFPPSAAVVLGGVAVYIAAALVHAPQAWLGTISNQVGWYVLLLLLPWAIAAYLRTGREGRIRKREEEVRRRAYQERLEIAREVHDVVGHGLAVINMQAGVALHVVDRRPEQARVALEAIRQASGDALEELRRTLAVFRQAESSADRRPPPGLDQLGALVDAMSESGLGVGLDVRGERRTTTAAVELAAYRIVQESLTNVLRHAGASHAWVRVAFADGWVDLEIVDDGRGRGTAGGSGGHGIAGMRERAAALGGELEAGPAQSRGFRVHARLPLTEDS
jgi:signal transduction histidine kinase